MDERTLEEHVETSRERTTENVQSSNPSSFNPSKVEWDTSKHITWNSLTTDWKEVKEKAAAVAAIG